MTSFLDHKEIQMKGVLLPYVWHFGHFVHESDRRLLLLSSFHSQLAHFCAKEDTSNGVILFKYMYQESKTILGKWRMTAIVTRSQAVARVADRTASHHLRGSRDVIGHVTIW